MSNHVFVKKELSKLERNIVKGIAIALSVPVVISMAKGKDSKVAEVTKPAIAVQTASKTKEFNVDALPEYCRPAFQRLSMQTYELCVHEGMSYVQVGNVIGNPGTNRGQSGNVSVWHWNENVNGETDGGMSATFANGKLISKAQFGLDSDRNF